MSDSDTFRPRVQVEADRHYISKEYLTAERFFSFGVQVELIRGLDPRSILEVGPGPGIVSRALRDCGYDLLTVDLDRSLRPSLAADAGALPLAASSVDAVLCAEVLEHMPFHHARRALAEFRRVARVGAVISVPDIRPFYRIHLTLPGLRWRKRLGVPWHRPPVHEFEGEHYWVLGARGYPPERLRQAAGEAGWTVEEARRPVEHSYHHFFVLR